MIDIDSYKKIINLLPILCVDIVVKKSKSEYLLVKRANEPLKGEWWVIGGRVLKGESLIDAARRKALQELSLNIMELSPIGYYEEFFEKNHFNVPSGMHSVSIVFETYISGDEKIELDSQSTEWIFSETLPTKFIIKKFN